MLKSFDPSNNITPLLKQLYVEPVLYVEELVILEKNSSCPRFYGYYNSQNIKEFLLISEHIDGSKTCFFYPETTNWKERNLSGLFDGKTYLQTNLVGKTIISLLNITTLIPHEVVYFRYDSNSVIDSENKNDVEIDINENVVSGKLKSIDINYYKHNDHIGYCGSNLVNSKTAMIGIEVDPQWRQQGIAKSLLSTIIKLFHKYNIEPVYACDKSNVPSYRLASHYFNPFWEYSCMFLNNWNLIRPLNESSILPDSLFMK